VVHAVDALPAVEELAACLRASDLDVIAHQSDVRLERAWRALVRSVEEASGGLDILLNNAGMQGDANPIDELSLEAWQRVIDVNQTGIFVGMKHSVPAMRRRGGGSIIQIWSTLASRGAVGLAAYTASKLRSPDSREAPR
jgi:NAD(P)-dependent dehydrogenase (short-subunit alcohol dehydrogenase family)